MSDPRALYQEVILDHNKKPRNYGTLARASHHAAGHNPLCGDHIDVALNLCGECVDNIAFQGAACAICKASASMMTVAVKGKTRGEVEVLIHEFLDMATGKLNLAALLLTLFVAAVVGDAQPVQALERVARRRHEQHRLRGPL